MVWDFAEVNPFAGAAGDFESTLVNTVEGTCRGFGRRRAGVRQAEP